MLRCTLEGDRGGPNECGGRRPIGELSADGVCDVEEVLANMYLE